MSVMIRGMEMPKDCRECRFMEYYSHRGETWCLPANVRMAKNYKPISYGGIPDWCPLVALPEEHGDLIDRNALKKDYRMGNDCERCETDWKSCQYDRVYSKMDFCEWIDDAPVVIEEEGEG